MANYQFSSDIVDDILERAGEPAGSASEYYNTAIRYMNRAYLSICSGGSELSPDIDETWWWLRAARPVSIILEPKQTINVTLTQRFADAIASSSPTQDYSGCFLKIDDRAEVYRIVSQAGVTLNMDSVFVGDTGVYTATLYFLEYSLTNVWKLISPAKGFDEGQYEIEGIELKELEKKYPLALISQRVPDYFALVSASKVRFNASARRLTRVEMEYFQQPTALTYSGSQEPLLPIHHRKIIADAALAMIYKDKDDSRAEDMAGLAGAGLAGMAKEHKREVQRIGRSFGRIFTRPELMRLDGQVLLTTGGRLLLE
jgi:hypothetical protein